jgi:hypothetical protein
LDQILSPTPSRLAGLNAVDFSIQPSRSDVEAIMTKFVPDFGTRQFFEKIYFGKSLLVFPFNLDVFNKMDEIGLLYHKALVS